MRVMHHLLTTLPSLLLAFGACVFTTPSVQASVNEAPGGIFRYQLRAFGALAGEARLTIDTPTLGQGDGLHRVRIEAETAGAAARIFDAQGEGTSLVNARFLPMRMKWQATLRARLRKAEATMGAKGLEGSYQYGKKTPRRFKHTTAQWPLDAVSAYLWLPRQDLKPGARYVRPFFDGKWMGQLEAKVGKVSSIQVPVGLREVVPIKISAGRKGKARRVTFWVGVDDRILYRIDVAHSVLGRVSAELVALRRPTPG